MLLKSMAESQDGREKSRKIEKYPLKNKISDLVESGTFYFVSVGRLF